MKTWIVSFLKITTLSVCLTGGFISAQDEKPAAQKQEASQEQTTQASQDTVNINTANLDQLVKLPRIGPAIGQRIIDFREEHGGFKTLEELMNVRGIGAKTFEKLKPLISL